MELGYVVMVANSSLKAADSDRNGISQLNCFKL